MNNSNLEKIVNACEFLLQNYPESEETQKYLDSRLSKESQNLFRFGYFPNVPNIQSLIALVGEEALAEHSLFYNKEIEDSLYPRTIKFSYFEDYPMVMPFRDVYGNVVGIVGRTLLSEEERSAKEISKYKNTKNFTKSHHLFGLFENKYNILREDSVYIVEGQFDVIKATEKGMNNIVAIGSCSLSPYQFSLINRYTNNLILLLDNDEAGKKGRKKIIDKYGKYSNIQNFYLPDNYKDIDECLSSNSVEDIEFIVEK